MRLMCLALPSHRLVNDAYLAIPAPSLAAAPFTETRVSARRITGPYRATRRGGTANGIFGGRPAPAQMWSESTFAPNASSEPKELETGKHD